MTHDKMSKSNLCRIEVLYTKPSLNKKKTLIGVVITQVFTMFMMVLFGRRYQSNPKIIAQTTVHCGTTNAGKWCCGIVATFAVAVAPITHYNLQCLLHSCTMLEICQMCMYVTACHIASDNYDFDRRHYGNR